jgi:uncharacterized protein YebE (UPF0316 family)
MYSCDRKQIKKKTLAEILLRFVFLTKKVKINYIAYALGFSLGNYIGMFIESRLALGEFSYDFKAIDAADETVYVSALSNISCYVISEFFKR